MSASRLLSRWGLLIVFVVVFGGFSAWIPQRFPTSGNVQDILTSQPPGIFIALAAMLVLVVGEFDLSIGATLGLSQYIVLKLITHYGLSWPAAILATLGDQHRDRRSQCDCRRRSRDQLIHRDDRRRHDPGRCRPVDLERQPAALQRRTARLHDARADKGRRRTPDLLRPRRGATPLGGPRVHRCRPTDARYGRKPDGRPALGDPHGTCGA